MDSEGGAVSAFQPVPSSSNPKPLLLPHGVQQQQQQLRSPPRDPAAALGSFPPPPPRRRRSRNSSTGSESSARNPMIGGSDEDEEANAHLADHEDGEDTEEITDTELDKKKNGQEVDRFTWPSSGGYDERIQLLGTEEESSERPSSDEEDLDKNAWNITREQLNYYTTQFFSMQPNPRGVIPGHLAKEFFEKSRLPITELRKIWQLSDVSKDGCLSLEEFLTAMHLVVLRRNEIDLPEELPPCLQPMHLRRKTMVDHRHNKDLYNTSRNDRNSLDGDEFLLQDHQDHDGASSATDTPDKGPSSKQLTSQVSESSIISAAASASLSKKQPTSSSSMAKVLNSRTNTSSSKSDHVTSPNSISSPGPKPVNFDFHRPDTRLNPNLVQPVAVRLSPESPVIPTSEDDESANIIKPGVKQGRREVVYEQLWNQDDSVISREESLSSLTLKNDLGPPPVSSRIRSDNSTDEEDLDDGTEIIDGGGLQTLSPSPPSLDETGPVSLPHFGGSVNSPPPPRSNVPPPPRAGSQVVSRPSHARSSSLDLKHFQGHHQQQRLPPPQVPPRQQQQQSSLNSPQKQFTSSTRDAKSLSMNIQQFKEQNSVIARTINELHQEVSDALEERIALEYQLEQIKSFGE